MSKNYQKTGKTHSREVFWQPKFEDTEIHTAAYTAFSKRIHVKLVTHMGFFLYFSLK